MLETRKQLKEIIDTKTKQIHAREKLLDEQRAEIHAWQEENKELYEQGRELRNEVEGLKLFKEKVISIMKMIKHKSYFSKQILYRKRKM